jgi:tripartite-type tricarboxylate transporter receptor subunit TctC
MEFPRRRFLQVAAGAVALPVASRIARAQAYPSRPVRVIVCFPPGGATDISARLIGQWLSERLGQQFIIENRPGAGTNIAVQAAVNSPPDGYTLLSVTSSNSSNATLYKSLPFDLKRDIAPIAAVTRNALVLEVNPLVPVKSVPEFITHGRANAGRISVASYGFGTTSHLAQELFKTMTGINLLHVPYRGDALALTDVIGGQVQATFSTISASIAYVRTSKLRALAVTSATRSNALPAVPTIGDFVHGYEATSWSGIGAPKATPPEIIELLNREINAGLSDPKLEARFAELGSTVVPGLPTDFAKLISEDTKKWAEVIRAANIKAE